MANQRHLAKLEKGKEAWNQWRANNPTVKPDLRGANMRGKHLEDFDFSYADIRGTNFKEANLKGSDFTKVIAGLQKQLQIILAILAVLFWTISGFFSIWLIVSIALLSSNNETDNFSGSIVCLIALIIFLLCTLRKGLTGGAVSGSLVLATFFAIDVAEAFAVSRAFMNSISTGINSIGLFCFTVIAFAGTLVLAAAVVFSVTFAVAETPTFAVAVVVAGAIVFVVNFLVVEAGFGAIDTTFAVAFAGVAAITCTVMLFGVYLGWRSFLGDDKDSWIRQIGVVFSTIGGTSFYNADLSNANFTQATLKNTDLRAKSLTLTCWLSAEKLDFARLGNSILSQANVRELLITRNGYQKSYQNANLRGANLAGADLEEANLKCANLSKANLSNANLKKANLTGVQAVSTDFTSAYLTGACLEAWNIDHTTNLENVDCQYIFLLENPNHLGSRERRPHDPERVFQPRDFTKLYQEVINTVEILLRKGANPEAFRQAFQPLMADNPNISHDSIKSVQKKGEDVLLTLEVPDETNKAEVEHKFFETYEARLRAATAQARLEEKDQRINDIKEITRILANKGSDKNIFLGHQEHIDEKTMQGINQSRNINITDSTVNASGAGAFNQGDITETVANTINQGTDSSDYSQLDLPQLLIKLKETIETDPNFPSEDKQDSYEEIDNLTIASQETDIAIQQEKASKALRNLDRIVKLLPAGAAFITIFKEISPHISSWFIF